MRKKRLCGIVCLCLVLSGGCSAAEPKEEKKTSQYFLFATPLSTHTLWQKAREGMQDACTELEVHCDWKGPIKISTDDMVDVINTGLLKKAEGIITQGVISKELIQKGNDKGIPFVLVDSPVEGSSPLTTISKDFDEQARLLLADIEEKLGKNKMLHIGIQVSDLSFDLARDQIASIEAVFAQHPGGFEIVAKSESRSDQLTSRNEWIKVLQKDTGMNVSINLAGENAIGFVDASEYMDNRDTILVYGVDDMKETLELIREGKVEGSIVTSFYQYGYESVHILYDYVTRGVRPEKERIPSYLVLVNKKNLNTYASALQKEKMHVE